MVKSSSLPADKLTGVWLTCDETKTDVHVYSSPDENSIVIGVNGQTFNKDNASAPALVLMYTGEVLFQYKCPVIYISITYRTRR